MSDEEEKQTQIWNDLFDRIEGVLATYGTPYDSKTGGDYLLVEDNYGWPRVTLSVQNLKMLAPAIVGELRAALSELPEWEIAIAVDVPGKEKDWPVMGLTIRKREIIDGLQRQYFPPAFQNWTYEGSRPGTGFD